MLQILHNEKIATRRKVANYIYYALSDIESNSEIFDEYNDLKEDIKGYIESLQNDINVKKILSNNNLILAYYYSIDSLDNNLFSKYMQKATDIYSESVAFDRNSFFKYSILLSNQLRTLVKQNKKYQKQIIKNEVEESTQKITLDAKKVSFVISLLGTLFVITGFLYNKFFLGHFGINVTDFFTISDYLSSSLDKIIVALISTLSGIIFYLYGMYIAYHRVIEAEQNNTEYTMPGALPILVIVIANTALIITYAYFYNEVLIPFFQINLVIGFFSFLEIIRIERFIKNNIQVTMVLVTIFFFSTYMYANIIEDIKSIEKNELKHEYKFTLENELDLNTTYIKYLGSSSNFYFFYNENDKSSYILKREDVKLITTNK